MLALLNTISADTLIWTFAFVPPLSVMAVVFFCDVVFANVWIEPGNDEAPVLA